MVASGWLRNLPSMTAPRSSGAPVASDRLVRFRRDDAIERARSITKAVGVASVAAVAALGIYLGRALPGHAPNPAGATAGSSAGAQSTGSGSGDPSAGLAPPDSPPAPTRQAAPVVSGSS